ATTGVQVKAPTPAKPNQQTFMIRKATPSGSESPSLSNTPSPGPLTATSAADEVLCDICMEELAIVRCSDCEERMCNSLNDEMHSTAGFRTHKRVKLNATAATPAVPTNSSTAPASATNAYLTGGRKSPGPSSHNLGAGMTASMRAKSAKKDGMTLGFAPTL